MSFATAALDTEYADTSGHRNTPAWLLMFTMRPGRRCNISGRTSCVHSNVPRRFTSMVRHHRSGSLPRRPDGAHDAGVVDQQVHGAKLVAELRDRLGHGPVVADVGGGRRRDATGRFDQCARNCEPTTTNRGGAH